MKDHPNREPADDETPMKVCPNPRCQGTGRAFSSMGKKYADCPTCCGTGEVPMTDAEIEQAQLEAAISRKESLSEDLLP